MNVKQVIVMRKDLNMRKGKQIAQGAHASMKVILDMMSKKVMLDMLEEWKLLMSKEDPIYEWLNGLFTKVVVYVESEADIHSLANKCCFMEVPFAVITDAGKTEFHGESIITCIAVGPDRSEKIDEITGDLPLL